MECFNCKTLYNETDHCPRLLISCGHSICEKCLKDLYYDNTITCPECKSINRVQNISIFPKNLALVNIKSRKIKSKANIVNESLYETGRDISTICAKHGNRIDAFCEKDRLLMCITCIIEDNHKSHDLNSIQAAAQKEKSLIHKAHELTKIVESKLGNMQKDIVDAYQQLIDSAEKSRISITQFFNNIRKILAERETSLKQKISNTLKKQENVLKTQDEKIATHLKLISIFYKECEKIENETDIKLLSESLSRMDLIKKVTATMDPIDFTIPFPELSKEQELNNIWKLINPQKVSNTISNYAKVVSKNPLSTPTLNVAKSNKVANKEALKTATTPQNICSSKVQILQAKKDPVLNVNAELTVQAQFPINIQLLNKNCNKVANNTLACKENINTFFKPELRRLNTPILANSTSIAEKKISSPIRAASTSSGNHLKKTLQQTYEPKLLAEACGQGGLTEYENQAVNLSQEKAISRSNDKNHNGNASNNLNNVSNLEIGSKTPVALQYIMKGNDNSRNDSIVDGFAYKKDKSQNFYVEKASKIDSMDDTSENGSQDYQKDNDSDNEPYTTKDFSMATDVEILNILTSDNGHKFENKDISKLDLSAIGFSSNNTNTKTKDRSNDASRRDLKSFIYESGTRYYLDNADIAQQKFDFSVICQQMSSSIYVIGGFIDNASCTIERYDLQKSKWDIAGSIQNIRTKFSAVTLPNHNILILGGKQDRTRIATCEEFNVKEGISKISDITLTTPKSGFGCLLIENDIYVCGGNDGHCVLKTFEFYNLTTKKWNPLPSLRYKRDEPALARGLDQKIYVIGGFGGPNNTCLSSVERYDPQSGVWETVANLNVPRRALAAVTLPDGIYAIGGFDGENYLSTVERYDDSLNEWVFVSSMNYPRCTFSAVSTGDCHNIYVFGGFDNGPLNTVERYSVINDSWEVIAPMQYKRFMHAAVIASNKNLSKS